MISIVAGKTKAGSNTTLADEYTGSTTLNVSFRQSRVRPHQGLSCLSACLDTLPFDVLD